jgi:hypothetical protein
MKGTSTRDNSSLKTVGADIRDRVLYILSKECRTREEKEEGKGKKEA